MVSIGTCELGKIPRVVAIVDELIPVEELIPRAGRADLLEMRIDCYREPVDSVVGYLSDVREKTGLPMIGTVRENEYTRASRTAIFKAIIPFVDCIDIELGTPISDEVCSAAAGRTIIVSEHDFDATPDVGGLQSMVDRSLAQRADIVKIATMANSREDVVRLLEFTHCCATPMVSLAMGPIGTVSRVIAPLFGSLFTYGYLTRPVAPGQLPVDTLISEVTRYFPA